MSLNTFSTFTICLGKGVPWTEARGMVSVNHLVFLALSGRVTFYKMGVEAP